MRKTSSKILCAIISSAMVLSSMTVDARADEFVEEAVIVDEFEDAGAEDAVAEDSEIVEFEAEDIEEESLEEEVVIDELEDDVEFEEEIIEFEEDAVEDEPQIEDYEEEDEEAPVDDEDGPGEEGEVDADIIWTLSDGDDDITNGYEILTVSATVAGLEVGYGDIPDEINGVARHVSGDIGFMDTVTELNIEKKIAKIGDSAFSRVTGWENLETVSIDSTVTTIGKSAFDGQDSLEVLQFGYFNAAGAYQNTRDISLLTTIGDNAFRGTSISELNVPKKVTSIGKHAFDGDDDLESVAFDDGSVIKTIGDYAFAGCEDSAFTAITFPNTLESIGNNAFEGCSSLATVTLSNLNSKLTKIGSRAFANCAALTTMYIPSSMAGKTIGAEAFDGCPGLSKIGDDSQSVNIKVGAGVITSDSFYKNFDNLTSIYTPDTLKSISPNALTVNTRALLERVELTAVTSIADKTFKGCYNLTSVTCPQTKTIGAEAFSGCTSLNGVSIPKVETLGDKAFYGCSTLSAIESKVKTIGVSVFEGCVSLATVQITECTKIGNRGFFGCSLLQNINISKVTYIGESAFEGCTVLPSTEANQIIPSKVTYIGPSAFKNCVALQYITVPNTVSDILAYTFEMTNTVVPTQLSVVKIEGGVKTIGSRAFAGCTGLGTGGGAGTASNNVIYLPATIKSIHNNAFMGCTNIETLGPVNNTVHYDIQYSYPEVVPGNLFNKFYNLESVTVPNNRGVKELGDSAFARCYNLETVRLEDTVTTENSLKKIGDNAFRSCVSLERIDIPMGVNTIGEYAFASCGSLGYVGFADSIKTIGAHAFERDITLGTRSATGTVLTTATIELPEALETIGAYAFTRCQGIDIIEIPMGVKTINEGAFMSCRNIASDITSAGSLGLSRVIIAPTVATLGKDIFADCNDALVIEGYRGVKSDSVIYKYALANGINFETHRISYTIRFEGNGNTGGAGMADITGCQSDENKQLPANTFTKTGQVFVGWNTQADGTGVTYKDKAVVLNPTLEEDAVVTLYAMWETAYSINYILNGGVNNSSNPTVYTAVDAFTLANASMPNTTYSFAGWYSDSACTTTRVKAIEKGTSGNITLYAKWSYKVVFNGNGASSGTMANQTLYKGISGALSANVFKKTGYTFTGWNTKRDGSGTKYSNKQKVTKIGNGNVTLYAQWKPNTYTIAFNANGGKGTMSKMTNCKVGTKITLKNNAYTRSGYTFLGWSTSKSAKTATYSNKSKVKDLTTKNGATVTLYAVWKKK